MDEKSLTVQQLIEGLSSYSTDTEVWMETDSLAIAAIGELYTRADDDGQEIVILSLAEP